MTKVDPTKAAIEIFIEISSKVKNKDIGSELRTRARDIPQMIENIGIIPTLSFCYAKSRDEDATSKAYELYLKAILKYLNRIGIIDDVNQALQEPIETLNRIYNKVRTIGPLLRPFLIEFKRLAEAKYKPKKGS